MIPEHLAPYARPAPPDLSTFLRALRPTAGTFGLSCRCGEAALLVAVAYNWEVVDAGCGVCGHELALYDPKAHGRAAWRGRADYDRPPFEAVANACRCRRFPAQLAAAVDYPGDAECGADFAWLAVAARCAACQEVRLVIDVESD